MSISPKHARAQLGGRPISEKALVILERYGEAAGAACKHVEAQNTRMAAPVSFSHWLAAAANIEQGDGASWSPSCTLVRKTDARTNCGNDPTAKQESLTYSSTPSV